MSVRIDCDSCLVRGLACHDCVVTVLLGPPPELTLADDEEHGRSRCWPRSRARSSRYAW